MSVFRRMRTYKGGQLLFALVFGCLLFGVCLAPSAALGYSAAHLSASTSVATNPPPLPVGSDGLPANVWPQVLALSPGEVRLLAVQPAGGTSWYAPSELGISSSDGMVGLASTSATASPDTVYGCSITAYTPAFILGGGGAVQGDADFEACLNLQSTQATVCVKDSETYGLHGCKETTHYLDDSWTAYSDEVACEDYTREWATYGTAQFNAIDGENSIWGFSSDYSSAHTC